MSTPKFQYREPASLQNCTCNGMIDPKFVLSSFSLWFCFLNFDSHIPVGCSPGMGCNTGGSRGRTESTAQTVQSRGARISLTFFKQRTKLAASSISPLLDSKRPPEVLAALKSIAALEFRFLSLLPLVTIPYSLETGSREVTVLVLQLMLLFHYIKMGT